MPIIWGPFSPTEIAQLDHLNASMQRYMRTRQASDVPRERTRQSDGERRRDRSAHWREILSDPDDLGPGWPDEARERWSTSLHEAAHCAALCALNNECAIESVVIDDEPGAATTHIVPGFGLDDHDRAIALAAGTAATILVGGSAAGGGDDFDKLHHLGFDVVEAEADGFYALTERQSMRGLRAAAERAIRPHYPFLTAVARRLFVRGEIDGDEVRALWHAWQSDRTGQALANFEL